MSLKDIRKIGDPVLREKSIPVSKDELPGLLPQLEKMWELIIEFRSEYGRGRGIAAPQIGLAKRIICLNTDSRQLLINPVISDASHEMVDIWDDCMSFPNLLVKVKRHYSLTVTFFDINWDKQVWKLSGDMAELIQHEYDHLDGILATDRAIDKDSYRWIDS